MKSHRTALAAGLLIAALAAGCQSAPTSTPATTSATPSATTSRPLAYAQCIRAHGVPDFPDPVDGHVTLGGPGAPDPASPQFQAANHACQALAPTMNPGTGAP